MRLVGRKLWSVSTKTTSACGKARWNRFTLAGSLSRKTTGCPNARTDGRACSFHASSLCRADGLVSRTAPCRRAGEPKPLQAGPGAHLHACIPPGQVHDPRASLRQAASQAHGAGHGKVVAHVGAGEEALVPPGAQRAFVLLDQRSGHPGVGQGMTKRPVLEMRDLDREQGGQVVLAGEFPNDLDLPSAVVEQAAVEVEHGHRAGGSHGQDAIEHRVLLGGHGEGGIALGVRILAACAGRMSAHVPCAIRNGDRTGR